MPANAQKNMFITIADFVSTEKSRTIKIEVNQVLTEELLNYSQPVYIKSEGHFGITYIQ